MEKESIIWNLAGFCLIMPGLYEDLYQVDANFNKLYGSENFYGLDNSDWFLLEKDSNKIAFLQLKVPSIISIVDENESKFEKLENISLIDNIEKFCRNITMQESAFFCPSSNQLYTLDSPNVFYKVLINDDLYFLLDENYFYKGYLLKNATNHIMGDELYDNVVFKELLLKMLMFCNESSYEKMDDMEEDYLIKLNELENKCILYKDKDARVGEIIAFIKNAKDTFYDIF